jgi:serine/threonine-protein kinase PRP4
VLIAKDAQNDNIDVAIKVIRNNDTMYVQHSLSSDNVRFDLTWLAITGGRFRAGLKEKELLEKITNADPKDKRHCIRIFDSFQYRNHLCLVLEPMRYAQLFTRSLV